MGFQEILAKANVSKELDKETKKVKEDVKEMTQLRVDSLKKIQEYFRQYQELGNLPRVELPVHIYWLNKGEDTNIRKLSISICDGKVKFYESSAASSLEIKDFCSKTKDDFFYTYKDGTIKWNDGYLNLLHQWENIRVLFEKEMSFALDKQISEKNKTISDLKTNFEYAKNFRL